jgi:uncharacterized protein YraI
MFCLIFQSMFRHRILALFSVIFSITVSFGFFLTTHAGGPIHQASLYPASVIVQKSANLRQGPGTDYAIVGGAKVGAQFNVLGCNTDCSWYQLAPDCWIAAFLVKPQEPVSPLGVAIPTVSVPTASVPTASIPQVAVTVHLGAPGPVVTPTPFVQTTRCPQTKESANTYAGPSTLFGLVDTRSGGECISVVGRNQVGDWYQLSHGMWILASAVLYAEPIRTMPVTEPTAIAILVPVVETQLLTPPPMLEIDATGVVQ